MTRLKESPGIDLLVSTPIVPMHTGDQENPIHTTRGLDTDRTIRIPSNTTEDPTSSRQTTLPTKLATISLYTQTPPPIGGFRRTSTSILGGGGKLSRNRLLTLKSRFKVIKG